MNWDNIKPIADFSTPEQPDQLQAQPVLFLTKDVNPDTRAKALSMQRELSLPVETIEANMQQLEADRAFTSFNLADYTDTPITMAGLSHPQESPIYKDDAENLSTWERFFGGVAKSWRAGKRNTELRDINERKFWGTATENDLQREKAIDVETKIYKPGGGFDNFFAQIPAQVAEMAPTYLYAMANAKEETLAGGAAGALAGPGFAVAGLALGLGGGTIIEMGKNEAYLAYKEFSELKDVTGKPIDKDAARGAAAMVGVVNGSIEYLGGKLALKAAGLDKVVGMLSRGSLKEAMKIPTVQAAMAKVGRTLAGGMFTEGATESLQEAVNVLIGEPMAAALNSSKANILLTPGDKAAERIAGAGKAGAQVGLAFGGPHTALGAVMEYSKAQRLERNATLSKELAGMVENSKTFQRMPEKWREHIQAVKEQYGVTQDVTVPFDVLETYFQEAGVNLDTLKGEIPNTAAAVMKAAATRSDVAIPVEDYAEYFARSDNFQKFLPDVRMHPELPTDREAGEMQAQLKQMVEQQPVKDQTVFEDIRGKLAKTETPEVADFQARLVASFFETQAQEMGIPAAELYGQYKIDVERSDMPDTELEQMVQAIQEGNIPTDTDIYGPSLQEFVKQYGDSATTKEEAIARGYFDTQDPVQVSDAIWSQAMSEEAPRYAYGAENTEALKVRDKIDYIRKQAAENGIDLAAWEPQQVVKGLKRSREIAPQYKDYIAPLKKMFSTAKDGYVSGSVQDADGNTVPTISVNPEWIKQKTVADYNKKYGENITLSKDDVEAIIKSIESGKNLTVRQAKQFEYLKEKTQQFLESNIESVVDNELDALEGEGFEFFAPTMMPVGNLAEGDVVVILGKTGVPDKLTHKGTDKATGLVLLQDGVTLELDPWDTLEVIAHQGKTVLHQGENAGTVREQIKARARAIVDKVGADTLMQGETDPRGFITMSRARDYFKVTLTGKSDLSTFLHESGHLFLELMNDLATRPDAAGRIITDMQTIRGWLGMQSGEAFTREHHEKFARGFEAYLMEGKAPSEDLRSSFQRFKAWLSSIYKELKALNVELTDEVRDVMDRMLASTEAINRTAEMDRLTPMFAEAEQAGLNDAEFNEYVSEFAAGMQEAEETMHNRLIAEITAHKRAENAKAVKAIRASVEQDVKGRPVYQALHFFNTGTLQDGTIPEGGVLGKMDRGVLSRMFPDLKYSGRLAVATMEGGANPMLVAQFFGFKNADEIITAIIDAPPVEKVIKTETKERFASVFGDSLNPRDIAKQARAALHNDKIADMITREMRILGNKMNKPVPAGLFEAMRIFAGEQIDNTEVGKLQPNAYAMAEQRYAAQAYGAASRNDWAAAATAKRLQLMNHWLFRKATAAQEEANKIRTFLAGFEKVEKRKKLGLAGGHYLESIDALLDGVELTHVSLRKLRKRQALDKYLTQMEEDGQIVAVPEELRNETGLKNYRLMTMAEFRGLSDAVKNIDHLARLKNKLLLAKDKRDFSVIMKDLVDGINGRAKDIIAYRKQNPTLWESFKSRMRSFDAELLKPEFLIRQLDGQVAGVLHNLVFAPLAEAQAKKYDMLKQFNRTLYDPLRKMPKEQKERMAEEFDFLGTPMKGHEVFAVALNMGNDSNIKKLIDGYEDRGYTEEKLMKELDRILTKEDWQLVQHIWNQLESLWPKIAELQKRNVGLEPPKIEPRKVMSKHGIFDGGYYPVMYDRNRTFKALQDAQKSNSLFENNYMNPKVASGFSVERTAYVAPLQLSLDALPKHINDVIHYITHFEAVTQANRIISHPEFNRAVSESVGREHYAELRPWLQAIANDGKADIMAGLTERFVSHTATGLSIMSMGFSLSTGLMQILGLSSSLSELGPRYLLSGLKGMLSIDQRKQAFDESAELRHTMATFDRDARAAYNQMLAMISGDIAGNYKYRHAQMTNFAFGVMGIIQREVNTATWIGAYNKAAAEGRTDLKTYADSIMRLTQSGGGVKDLARIQRQTPLRRLFTAYYTYFSVLYGQLRAAGQRLPAEPLVGTAQLAALILLPTLIEKLMRSGLPDDDEPPDEWLKHYFGGAAFFGVGTLPIARDLIQGAFGKYDYGMSPGAAIIERGLAAAKKAGTGEDMTESQIKAAAKGLGLFLHLPASQFIKSFEYLDAMLDGDVEEPVREFFFGIDKGAKK